MKQAPSKLDPHADKLDSWLRNQSDAGEGLTLRACVEQLAALGAQVRAGEPLFVVHPA